VTSHVPLREVADAITLEGVADAVSIVNRYLSASGIAKPRIAVAGLNPHAGDGGSLGREEIDVIAPAIEAAKRSGLDVRGPMPSDTVFVAGEARRLRRGRLDVPRPGPDRDEADGLRSRRHAARRLARPGRDLRERNRVRHRRQGHRERRRPARPRSTSLRASPLAR
jgi:hypothetical protein